MTFLFATNHGKSPCDGIGGTRSSLRQEQRLQVNENNQILNPNQVFQWITQNIVGIIFFYMSEKEGNSNVKAYELEQRYSRCSTVSSTTSHHGFIPQSKSTLVMKRLSSDEVGAKLKLFNHDNVTLIWSHEQLHQNLQTWKICACMTVYDTLVL